ncbi:MAG: hypothetical protein ACTTKH_04970 [Treponema sp.]
MRLRKLLSMAMIAMFATLFLFACNQPNGDKKKKDKDDMGGRKTPVDLMLKSFKVKNKTVSPEAWISATQQGNDWSI